MLVEAALALVDDASGSPLVTVDQIDVRDGDACRWTFHTSVGVWWSVGPGGERSEPADSLRAALRSSDALDPLPWRAIIIDTSRHTDDVLAELAGRVVGRGDRAILDVEWHDSVIDINGMDMEFIGNQWSWLDSDVPVLVDGSMCGTLAGPGDPVAFLFYGPSDDTMLASVEFQQQWINIEVLTPHDSYCRAAGEVAPGRFAVEWTEPGFFVRLYVEPSSPAGRIETEVRLRSVLAEAIGLDDLSQIDWLIVMDDGRYFRGSFALPDGLVEFEGNAAGPGIDLVGTLAREHEVERRSD